MLVAAFCRPNFWSFSGRHAQIGACRSTRGSLEEHLLFSLCDTPSALLFHVQNALRSSRERDSGSRRASVIFWKEGHCAGSP